MPENTPAQRLKKLQEAYEWEQEQIRAWEGQVKNRPGDPGENTMNRRFAESWLRYFQEVRESNDKIIKYCATALRTRRQSEIDEAIRYINRVEHRKGSASSVSSAAHAHRHQSKYFKTLDALIDLENEVRDYIEHYLHYGP